jgi:hypothetical protein
VADRFEARRESFGNRTRLSLSQAADACSKNMLCFPACEIDAVRKLVSHRPLRGGRQQFLQWLLIEFGVAGVRWPRVSVEAGIR